MLKSHNKFILQQFPKSLCNLSKWVHYIIILFYFILFIFIIYFPQSIIYLFLLFEVFLLILKMSKIMSTNYTAENSFNSFFEGKNLTIDSHNTSTPEYWWVLVQFTMALS
jgi:hypothetical protein